VAGVRSAFANPEVYRGKIVGLILAVLSFGAAGLDPGVTNAINPDLRGFFRHGGKLLQYHGWNDPGISPFNSIDYYNSVLKFMGGVDKVVGSYRLLHGSWNGSLRVRRGAEYVRCDWHHRTMG